MDAPDPDVLPKAKKSLLSQSLLLVPVQIVLRGGEAVFPMLLAAWFGSTRETDANTLSFSFFAFIGSLVFGAYQDSTLVGLLVETKLKTPERLGELTGALFGFTAVAGAVLAVLLTLAGLALFRVVYPPDLAGMMVRLSAPLAVYLVLLGIKTYLVTLLNAEHRYQVGPAAAALGMLTLLTFVFTAKGRIGIIAVPIGTSLSEAVQVVLLLGATRRLLGLRMRLSVGIPAVARPVLKQVFWSAAGGTITRVNPIVDQHMATSILPGGATMLRYSGDVATVGSSLLGSTLLPVFVTHLSEAYARRDFAAFRRTANRAQATVAALMGVLAVAMFLLRGPLLRAVYLHGSMQPAAVERIASLMGYHLLGLPAFGVLLVQVRAYQCLRKSRWMVPLGFANAALNVVFNVALVPFFGLEGVALGTSLVHTVLAAGFFFVLSGHLREAAAGAEPVASS
jgi:putative peptidoglycan lipid II flippase